MAIEITLSKAVKVENFKQIKSCKECPFFEHAGKGKDEFGMEMQHWDLYKCKETGHGVKEDCGIDSDCPFLNTALIFSEE